MGGKASAPPAPDYTAAAKETASGNIDAARVATTANRVNQYGPNGSIEYTQDPNNQDRWSMTTKLSPDQQALYDQNAKISQGLMGLASGGLGQVQQAMQNPFFDESKLPQSMVNAGQTGQDAIMARLNPQFQQNESMLINRLANQGITPGSEAYSAAMRDFNNARNDAYTQAALQGIGIGQNARQQAITEQAYQQDRPLNIINALRSGNQVSGPQFQNVAQQATTSGPDLLGAANATGQYNTNVYNANVAQRNGLLGGLANLGGSLASAYLFGGK